VRATAHPIDAARRDDRVDYDAYIAAFNRNDDETFMSTFFAEDAVIEGPGQRMTRDEFAARLRDLHRGVRETIVPVAVLQDGDRVMSEVDITFDAEIDRPDHPMGTLRAGESATVKMITSYVLRDGLIVNLRRAWWPPA
jgi:hypothetical protein